MASAKFRPNEEGVYDEKPSLTPYATAIENVARLVGCCHRTLHCLPGGAVHCHRRSRRSDTFPRAINKYDAITGNYCAGTCGGFVRTPDGTITTYKAETGSTAALANQFRWNHRRRVRRHRRERFRLRAHAGRTDHGLHDWRSADRRPSDQQPRQRCGLTELDAHDVNDKSGRGPPKCRLSAPVRRTYRR